VDNLLPIAELHLSGKPVDVSPPSIAELQTYRVAADTHAQWISSAALIAIKNPEMRARVVV